MFTGLVETMGTVASLHASAPLDRADFADRPGKGHRQTGEDARQDVR